MSELDELVAGKNRSSRQKNLTGDSSVEVSQKSLLKSVAAITRAKPSRGKNQPGATVDES